MSKQEIKKKTKKRGSRKLRRQKRVMGVLLLLTITVGAVQVQAMVKEANSIDSNTYSALVFSQPLKQTLSVLQIAKNEGQSLFNNENKLIEYSDIKNYREENLERYQAYHSEHEDLLTAEVVWRVNIGLDYEDYANVEINSNPDSVLAIVNKNLRIDPAYQPSDLVKVDKYDIELRKEAAKAFESMLKEVEKAGLSLKLTQGYMSEDLVAEELEAYLAQEEVLENDYGLVKVGHNEHQLGLAIDIENTDSLKFAESDLYFWLKNNAHRFGFIFRYEVADEITHYSKELNHLRYVGEKTAVDMYEKNIKHLEEYLNKYENK